MNINSKIEKIILKENNEDCRDPLVKVYVDNDIDGLEQPYSKWNHDIHDDHSAYPSKLWREINEKVESYLEKREKKRSMMEQQNVQAENKKRLRWAEPYFDNEGNLWVIFADTGECHSISEWKNLNPILGKMLLQYSKGMLWPNPTTPDVNSNDPNLKNDIEKFLEKHYWTEDSRWIPVHANWVLCSYILEYLPVATRLILFGPTRSGKTKAIQTIQRISYRSMDILLPTPSVMYRVVESMNPTLFIDEYQDLQKERVQDINTIIKGGFSPDGKVPRTRTDDYDIVQLFRIFAPVAIGTQILPAVDIQNRSLLTNMMEKPSSVHLIRGYDEKTAAELRGRLLSFRIRVLSGISDIQQSIEKASQLALSSITLNGIDYKLDDRSVEMASELLIPDIIFNRDGSEVLGVLLNSQKISGDELLHSEAALVFYALTECYERTESVIIGGRPMKLIGTISTKDVMQQLREDLKEDGNEDILKVSTKRVHSVLKSLGFSFVPGTNNKSCFSLGGFEKTYAANLAKFGQSVNVLGNKEKNKIEGLDELN